ncbi:MAG: hypothetical protein HOQ45_06970 [Nocardioidaceae bacterium]|nr:hypothetical protein [Nocardioidaceae bacterium]
MWTDKSVADGFFVVTDASSELTNVAQGAFLTATWSMTLARLGTERDVEFESRVPTIARSTELVGQTPSFWHAPPPATIDYYTGATVPSATVTRTSAEGTVLVYRGIPANVAPRWTCPADGYMAGSPRVLVDGNRIAGVDTPAGSTWEINNGIVQVASGASGRVVVSAWSSGAWHSPTQYVFRASINQLTVPTFTILRNDPEEVTVRLTYTQAPGRVTVDLGLRRGSRYVAGVIKRQSAAELGVVNDGGATMTVVTGGLKQTTADADNNRIVMGSSRTVITSTGPGASISKLSVTSFDFFLGHEVGASPAAGDAFADLLVQYLGTSGDRTRVVRR